MLRGIWTFLVLAVTTPGLGIPAILITAVRPRSDAVLRAASLWSRLLLRASGIRPDYRGLESLQRCTPCLIIANHQSAADIWALVPILPRRTGFVAKRELFRVPVFGWAMRAAGFVAIDRERRERAIRSLHGVGDELRAGRSFVMFAEGTRSRDGRLGPFKKGAFHLALKTGVPVVPVAISGSWDTLRPASLRVNPGAVRVTACPPIAIDAYLPRDVDGLSRAVRTAIAANLEREELAEDDRAAAGGG